MAAAEAQFRDDIAAAGGRPSACALLLFRARYSADERTASRKSYKILLTDLFYVVLLLYSHREDTPRNPQLARQPIGKLRSSRNGHDLPVCRARYRQTQGA